MLTWCHAIVVVASRAGPLHGLSRVSSHRMCTFSPRFGWRKCKMYCSCRCIVVTPNIILKHIQNIVYFLIPQTAWHGDTLSVTMVWCHEVLQCYVTASVSALTRPSTRLMNDPSCSLPSVQILWIDVRHYRVARWPPHPAPQPEEIANCQI